MRPRVFPAEDEMLLTIVGDNVERFNEAAGIPRGRRAILPYACQNGPCFNEAAGIPRGRPARGDVESAGAAASMRPRVFPAEDARRPERMRDENRASMRPRVFPAEDDSRNSPSKRRLKSGFNEAAGIPRGRRQRGR